MSDITLIAIVGAVAVLVLAIFIASEWIVRALRRSPRSRDEVERGLGDILAAFRRECDQLVARYAEEFSLVKFLEQADAEGRAIDASEFKAGALNRANLLRIRQLEDAIASHVAAKSNLVRLLRGFVANDPNVTRYVGETERKSRIADLKKQIGIEEEYISLLQSQLAGLRITAASA